MTNPNLDDLGNLLHVLRNPYGVSEDVVRAARLKAAELLESRNLFDSEAAYKSAVAQAVAPIIDTLRAQMIGEPVGWQWRRVGERWSGFYGYEPRVTQAGTEKRALFAGPVVVGEDGRTK